MDFLRKYLSTIKAQLNGLTVSQKLLIGLLVVVMVATIFFTVVFSAKPDMVTLIAQPMSAEEINRVEMNLKGKYDYQVQGDKVLVPADKAYQIRGELFAMQALPKDTTEAFTSLIKDSNFLKTDSTTTREWNVALGTVLAQTLRSFPYIQDATVIIGQGERASLGRDQVPSSATAIVKTRDGEELSTQKVVAIVDMIRGAVPGLKADHVTVTDGLRSYHAPTDDTPLPSDLMAFKKSIESDLTGKLQVMFSGMGDVKIAVNAIPDLSIRKQEKDIYDPKGVVKAVKQETDRDTSSSEGSSAGEPGVKPNVAIAANDSSGSKTSSTTSDTSTQNEVRFSHTTETAALPPGTEIKDLTAAISIPRSYFVSMYRRMNNNPKADPDDKALQPVIDEQLKLADARAKNAIGAKSDDQIHVDWYDDTLMMREPDLSKPPVAASPVPVVLLQYGKPAILLALAGAVLGVMLLSVRRAVPGAAGADVDPSIFFNGGGAGGKGKRKGADAAHLDTGDDVFGEANEGEAVLTGIELDDDTVQSRKMVDEVSTMIKENPENAASLVKRWMSKGK